MKRCFSPYKKDVRSALAFPLFGIGLFIFMGQYDNIKPIVPFIFFSMFLIAPVLMGIPYLGKCPKCEQKIACSKENCFDFFGHTVLKGIFTSKCKKCGHDLSLCEDE